MKQRDIEELDESPSSAKDIQELISTRAYEIFQNRGGEHGRDLDDWLQAENEVLASLPEEIAPRAKAVGQTDTGGRTSTERTEPQAGERPGRIK